MYNYYFIYNDMANKLLFCFSLSVLLALLAFYLMLRSVANYSKNLDSAIKKWYTGKELTKKEEKIFFEYAEIKEKLGYWIYIRIVV